MIWYEVSKRSFNCTKCQKVFEIKGHWYNQVMIEWWGEAIWIFHCLKHHRSKWNKKDMKYAEFIFISFFPLIILQILDIVAHPFKQL